MAKVIVPLVEPAVPEVVIPPAPPQPEAVSDEGSPFTEKVEKLVAKALETVHVQGLAIAVINGDKIFSKVRSLTQLLGRLADQIYRATDTQTWRRRRRSSLPRFLQEVRSASLPEFDGRV